MAYDQVGEERKLQLQELEELHLEAYENSCIYKQRVKQFHDHQILRKEFHVCQKVLLFKSRLRLIADKLRSKPKPSRPKSSRPKSSRPKSSRPKPGTSWPIQRSRSSRHQRQKSCI
ncbi:hypothetical protein CR513_10404, partial [Mucuna pruriens]